jgi:hypothetical protein
MENLKILLTSQIYSNKIKGNFWGQNSERLEQRSYHVQCKPRMETEWVWLNLYLKAEARGPPPLPFSVGGDAASLGFSS